MIAAALAKSENEPPAKLADRAMALFYESVKRVIIADYQHEVNVRHQELITELGIETEAWIFDSLNYKYPLERDEILANMFSLAVHRSVDLLEHFSAVRVAIVQRHRRGRK